MSVITTEAQRTLRRLCDLCGSVVNKKKKAVGFEPNGLCIIPAASYFPTQLPGQYHRRCGA